MAALRSPGDKAFQEWLLTISLTLFEGRSHLRDILYRNEELIYKRWAGKTITKRTHILHESWKTLTGESMPLNHRPDIHYAVEVLHRDCSGVSPSSIKRPSYCISYLSVEDLVKPNVVPHLLQARAKQHPTDLVKKDLESLRFLLESGVKHSFPFDITPELRVRFTFDQQDGHSYAVYDADETPKTINVEPTTAFHIMIVQGSTMCFLVELVRLILNDLGDTIYDRPIMPSMDLPSIFAHHTPFIAEASYASSTGVDLCGLTRLITARREEIADNVRALRAEPGFFNAFFKDILHEIELCMPRSMSAARQTPVLYSLSSTFDQIRLWSHILLHCEAAQIAWSSEDPVPEDVLLDTINLRHTLIYFIGQAIWQFMSKFENYGKIAALRQIESRLPLDRSLRYDCTAEKIFRAYITAIWKAIEHRNDGPGIDKHHGIHLCLYLPHVVAAYVPEDLRNISFIREALADVSLFAVCVQQLDLTVLWRTPRITPELLLKARDMCAKGFVTSPPKLSRAEKRVFTEVNTIIGQLGPPGHYFDYPVDQPPSELRNETMRSAERKLYRFWTAFDAYAKETCFGTEPHDQYLADLVAEPRHMTITPVHKPERIVRRVAPATLSSSTAPDAIKIQTAKPLLTDSSLSSPAAPVQQSVIPSPGSVRGLREAGRVKATVAKIRNPDASMVALRELVAKIDFERQLLTERTITQDSPICRPPKEKVEKNATTTPSLTQETAALDTCDSEVQALSQSIKVHRNALKVFKVLFYNPAANGTPGEISWKDFMAALDAAGLSGQKLHGSAWHFAPKTEPRTSAEDGGGGGLTRSIHFHEPHPSHKIRFYMARDFGRRLRHAYGWTIDTFVLDKA